MSRISIRCRRRTAMKNLFGVMLAAVFSSGSVFAQTDGTWGVQGGNWSVGTNWVGGNVADSGGVATFDNFRGQLSNIAVTVDTTSRTLSQINFNQSFSVGIAGTGGGTILVSPTGLTLNSIASTISSPTSYYNTVNGISAVIAGVGGVVKTGQGNVALSGANTFTGNVVINEGALWLTAATTAGQETALGNIANSVEINGGILGVSTSALTTTRSVVVGANGGTMRLFSAANLNGSLSGSGLLTNQLGTLTLGGTTSGFTGGILVDNSTVNLTGTTALGGSADVVVGGTLGLLNTTTNVANRLNGRSIVSYGGNLNFTAGTAGAMSEAAGNLVLASGSTTISVTPSASTGATVSFSGLTRQDRSTVLFRGTGLGTTGATANVLFTSAPGTLIGGGGDPNTATNASILPFAIGSRVGGVTSGANMSFVTWDSTTQRITALDVASGYATNLAFAANDDNVNLTANSAVNFGGQTVNSLRIGGAFTLDGASTDVLNVTSGAILSTTSTAVINAPINFGSNEGVVFAAGGLTINGAISGTNGLTKSGVGILTLGSNNTYTGVTTLAHGQTRVGGGVITADGSAPSAFGQDTSAIQILSSNNTAGAATRLWTSGNLVINRDINVKLGGQLATGFGTAGLSANESLTINGNLALNAHSPNMLNRFVTFEAGNTLADSVTINGNVSGNGGLRAAFGSYNVLSGNNTYSGGTLVGTSTLTSGTGNTFNVLTETWDARSSTAFGTGAVFIHTAINATQPVSGTGLILSNGSGPNTFANDFHLTNGFARFGGTQAMTINGNVFLNSAATNNSVITVESTAAPVRINSAITGGGLVKNGAGTLTLAGNNTYSGQTIIRQGTLSVQSIGNGGSVGNLGQAPSTANYLALSGNSVGNTGTLAYTGAGESTDRLFTLQGSGGTIDSSGSGALQFSNSTGAIGMGFGSVTVNGVNLVANAGVVGISTTIASQLVVGSTVGGSGTGIAAGTTVTEVGANFVRLSATGTNAAGPQNLTFTLPTALTNRTLTLTGTNSGLNTIAPTLANGATINLAVAKTGSGIWQLTGANTYSGGTTINQGTLLANNTSGSAFGTGNVVVGANGTLGGSGTILPGSGNSITVSGTIAPGNSAGTLNIGSSTSLTTLNIDGVYSFELSQVGLGGAGVDSGLSSGTATHDVLNVFGTTNFGALATVNVTSLGVTGFNSLESYSWRILTTNGGIINGLPTLGIVAGGDFAAFQSNFSLGAANGDLFLNFAAVPEPSTMALLSSVMIVGYLGRRRFKKANQVPSE